MGECVAGFYQNWVPRQVVGWFGFGFEALVLVDGRWEATPFHHQTTHQRKLIVVVSSDSICRCLASYCVAYEAQDVSLNRTHSRFFQSGILPHGMRGRPAGAGFDSPGQRVLLVWRAG